VLVTYYLALCLSVSNSYTHTEGKPISRNETGKMFYEYLNFLNLFNAIDFE